MSSLNTNSENIEKVSETTGIVGYSSSYISLQAMNGIFINGIGSGNSAQSELPFSNEADENGFYSGMTNGDFWISGQNGGAVIKSCNRSTPGPNGPGIGSIHINSANGDVVVNVPNGNFESNVAGDTVNNNSGNVTNNTTGNQVNHIQGNQTTYTTGNQVNYIQGNQASYTTGNQYALANGNQSQVALGSSNTVVLGTLNQLALGLCTQITLGDQINFNAVGLQNVVLGDILDLFIGAHNTVTVGFITDAHPAGRASASELEAKEVQAKLANHTIQIENVSTVARDCGAVIQSAGIHVFT